jgi:hypothetical protein
MSRSRRISSMRMMRRCRLSRAYSTFTLTFSSMINNSQIICNHSNRMLNQVSNNHQMVNLKAKFLSLIIQDKESKIFLMDCSEETCRLLCKCSILSKPKLMGSSHRNQTQCLEVPTIYSIFSECLHPQVKASPSQLSIFSEATRSPFLVEPSWSKTSLIK